MDHVSLAIILIYINIGLMFLTLGIDNSYGFKKEAEEKTNIITGFAYVLFILFWLPSLIFIVLFLIFRKK